MHSRGHRWCKRQISLFCAALWVKEKQELSVAHRDQSLTTAPYRPMSLLTVSPHRRPSTALSRQQHICDAFMLYGGERPAAKHIRLFKNFYFYPLSDYNIFQQISRALHHSGILKTIKDGRNSLSLLVLHSFLDTLTSSRLCVAYIAVCMLISASHTGNEPISVR